MSGQERGGGRNIQRGTPYRGRGSAGPSRYHHRISGGPQQYLRRNNNDGGRGGINPYAQRTYSAAASDIDQQSVERADPRSSSCSFPPQEQSIERTQSFSSSAASSLVSNFGPRVKLEEEQQQHQQQQQKPSELAVVPSSSSSKALLFPCRPGFGTKGRKCLVKANYFLVQLSPDKSPHHYDVSITPEVMSKGTSRAVIKQLVNLNKESYLGENELVYDGGKSIYTAGPLPFTSKNFTIKLLNQANGDKSTPRREKQFTVSIRLVGRPDLHHLQQFFMAKQRDAPQEIFQLLDLVLRESPSLNYITVGRSFFSPLLGEPSPIGEGFMCWNGFHQSLRPTQMGLSLNIDLSARSFFKPILVIDFVSEFLNTDTSEPLSDKDCAKVKKVLKGVKVEVTYRSNNSRPFRRYRISGITEQQTNQLMFPIDEEGTQMTVVQYFKDTYKKTLEHATWPSLQVGNDGRTVYIPMEVCKIVDGQRYSKKLNKKQVAGMLRATCQCPYKRENSILKMVRANNYNGDKFVNEFGLLVSEELTSVEARVLFPPQLKYHDTGIDIDCVPRGGQWNMMNKKMVNGATINYWTCLNFSRLNQDVVVRFCRELIEMCIATGMRFTPKELLPIRTVCGTDHVDEVLKDVHMNATARLREKNIMDKELELLIVVLPEDGSIYGRVKTVCETELGIVTQCCLPKIIIRPNNQIRGNLALKINAKVGGRNTVLNDFLVKRVPLVTDMPTIIFGADVTHPKPFEDSSTSIAAVVASQDWPEITKYCSLVSTQMHRQDIIQDLYTEWEDPKRGKVAGGMIRDLLISFRESNKQLPGRIIFYRDGVSEGQFCRALQHELQSIQKACASIESNYCPTVTFVVVQKRHHTRLFPFDHNDQRFVDRRSGNILPGTVVDTQICHPVGYDFYLCSHAGIQGTNQPPRYYVVWDENGFKPDDLQTLTNNLCYTYASCTRSVSVVPAVYYAHKMALRAKHYMEETYEGESSAGGSGNGDQGPSVVRPLPKIKENVRKLMFYC